MQYPTVPRWVLSCLLATGLVLLAGAATSGTLAALVGLLGDSVACRGLSWAAVALAVVLLTDLVCLVFALAVRALGEPSAFEPSEQPLAHEAEVLPEEPGT